MKKFLLILILNFLLSGNVYSKDYKVGEQIENNVELDKILSIGLSPGKWTVVEEDYWSYYAFSGKYIFIFKEIDNEISEYYSLGYLDTSGKRISDVNSYFYEMIYKNKYDGCYKRPEYYILELYNKGSTTNCLIVRHIDPNKELYNPDDKNQLPDPNLPHHVYVDVLQISSSNPHPLLSKHNLYEMLTFVLSILFSY